MIRVAFCLPNCLYVVFPKYNTINLFTKNAFRTVRILISKNVNSKAANIFLIKKMAMTERLTKS